MVHKSKLKLEAMRQQARPEVALPLPSLPLARPRRQQVLDRAGMRVRAATPARVRAQPRTQGRA